MCPSRAFFRTREGYIGLGPDYLEIGDIICVLFGGRVPYILRPEKDYFLLVAECYVQGVMGGEAVERMKGEPVETFILRCIMVSPRKEEHLM